MNKLYYFRYRPQIFAHYYFTILSLSKSSELTLSIQTHYANRNCHYYFLGYQFETHRNKDSSVNCRKTEVLQIRKAGSSSVFYFFYFFTQYSSWMEMASQGSFNMNTSLIPILRPGRELPRIFSKQTSSLKWQNV